MKSTIETKIGKKSVRAESRLEEDRTEKIKKLTKQSSNRLADYIRRELPEDTNYSEKTNISEKLLSSLAGYAGVNKENISLFTGANQAFESFVRMVSEPGRDIIIAGPVTKEIFQISERYGLNVIEYSSAAPFDPDAHDLLKLFSGNTAAIYAASPNLITGAILNGIGIRIMLDHLKDIPIFIDETFFEYFDNGTSRLIDVYQNLFIKRSFNAALSLKTGKCEYIIASSKNIEKLKARATGKESLKILKDALDNLHDIKTVNSRIETIRENMLYMTVKLRSLGISCRMTAVDFILAEVPSPERVIESLGKNNIRAEVIIGSGNISTNIRIFVSDQDTAGKAVTAFENMPPAWFVKPNRSRSSLTIRRTAEVVEGCRNKISSGSENLVSTEQNEADH